MKIHRNVTLPAVLYGCESWSLILREKPRVRVLENRVLRKVYGPTTGEETGKWKILHNKELCNLCPSPNVIWVIKSRRMRWAGNVAGIGRGEERCRHSSGGEL
jgi:hypothetical protein